jgi:hypothetical protein
MHFSAQQISQQMEKILRDLGSYEYLVNPYFRISKATPRQIKKYHLLNFKFAGTLSKILLISSLPMIMIRIILYFLLSLLFSFQYKIFKKNLKQNNIIFISHATQENLSRGLSDEFFALMPKYYQSRKHKVTILYTNHGKFSYIKKINILKSSKEIIFINLMPKFLKPQEFITYVVKMFHLASNCLILNSRMKHNSPIYSAIMVQAAKNFFSRDTYNNYLLSIRLQSYLKPEPPYAIFLTFEGHSYEQYLIESVSSKAPNIKFVLYQHSPIVPDHFGIIAFLKSNQNILRIYTTGITYLKYLKKISNIPNYKVIGSQKYFNPIKTNVELNKQTVLLIPDGGEIHSTIKFLRLGNYLQKCEPKYAYVLRLHPHLKEDTLIKVFLFLLNHRNQITISDNSLQTDLGDANYVIFRGSMVGVQSLNAGATPVFFGNPKQSGLNALSISQAKFYTAHKRNEVLTHIKRKNIQLTSKKNETKFKCMFEQINYKELDNYD